MRCPPTIEYCAGGRDSDKVDRPIPTRLVSAMFAKKRVDIINGGGLPGRGSETEGDSAVYDGLI